MKPVLSGFTAQLTEETIGLTQRKPYKNHRGSEGSPFQNLASIGRFFYWASVSFVP
jgi:hypothetical protein